MVDRVKWDEKTVAMMMEKWSAGLSGAQIAAMIPHATRCAVLGKLHRMNIHRGGPNRVNRGGRRTDLERKRERAMVEREGNVPDNDGSPFSKAKMLDVFVGRAKPVVSGLPALVGARLTGECQWPHGDPRSPSYGVCGKPAYDRSPYCEACKKLAYQPRRPDASIARFPRRSRA